MTPIPAHSHRRKGRVLAWVPVLVFVALAIVMVAVYAISDFSRGEERLKDFCRATKKGETLDKVSARAEQAGLKVKPGRATGPFGPSLTVWATSALLPDGSFCSVYHDGSAVTQVFWNPWYE